MDITLEELAKKIETVFPTAKAMPITEATQIVVTFSNRPDVEVSLLTPSLQQSIRKGFISLEDLTMLLFSIQAISKPVSSAT